MAVSVLNAPTTPNASKTKLVYSLSSSLSSNPQFRYVTDIYLSGSSDLLTRLITYPNLTGNGIVDVAKVLDDHLDYDNYWQITGSIQPVETYKTFDIRFGEEYGTSISSSRTIYTGSTSNYLGVFPAIVDANSGDFNFNTSSFESPPGPPYPFPVPETYRSSYLTDQPNTYWSISGYSDKFYTDVLYLNSSDYHTATVLYDIPAQIRVNAGYLTVNNTFTAVTSSLIDLSPFEDGRLNTIGLGPQNLKDLGGNWDTLIDNNFINFVYTSLDYGAIRYWIADKIPLNYTPTGPVPCSSEYTRFAFINRYGVWDYYNVYNPTRKVVDVDRKIYDQNYVDYSSAQSIYSYESRGETQYLTEYTDRFEITTDFVNKRTADWLTQLFDSPDVYIQQDGNFIPVIITNTAYNWNMNENRQKLFQFTIQYKFANPRYDR